MKYIALFARGDSIIYSSYCLPIPKCFFFQPVLERDRVDNAKMQFHTYQCAQNIGMNEDQMLVEPLYFARAPLLYYKQVADTNV